MRPSRRFASPYPPRLSSKAAPCFVPEVHAPGGQRFVVAGSGTSVTRCEKRQGCERAGGLDASAKVEPGTRGPGGDVPTGDECKAQRREHEPDTRAGLNGAPMVVLAREIGSLRPPLAQSASATPVASASGRLGETQEMTGSSRD